MSTAAATPGPFAAIPPSPLSHIASCLAAPSPGSDDQIRGLFLFRMLLLVEEKKARSLMRRASEVQPTETTPEAPEATPALVPAKQDRPAVIPSVSTEKDDKQAKSAGSAAPATPSTQATPARPVPNALDSSLMNKVSGGSPLQVSPKTVGADGSFRRRASVEEELAIMSKMVADGGHYDEDGSETEDGSESDEESDEPVGPAAAVADPAKRAREQEFFEKQKEAKERAAGELAAKLAKMSTEEREKYDKERADAAEHERVQQQHLNRLADGASGGKKVVIGGGGRGRGRGGGGRG